MSEFNKTKTYKNLCDAFAGESMARNRYDIFARNAEKKGSNKIANFFRQLAINEHEHAKLLFSLMNEKKIGSGKENLESAIAGEAFEADKMYVRMAKEAKDEGYADIAALLEKIGNIEKNHQNMAQRILLNLQNDKNAEKRMWKCQKCGRILYEDKPYKVCDVCGHENSFIEVDCCCHKK